MYRTWLADPKPGQLLRETFRMLPRYSERAIRRCLGMGEPVYVSPSLAKSLYREDRMQPQESDRAGKTNRT